MSTGRKLMREQELLEDAPTGNGKFKLTPGGASSSRLARTNSNVNDEPQPLEKQSTFSKLSKSVFSYTVSTANNESSSSGLNYSSNTLRTSPRGYHRSTSKSAPLKIEELFDNHFSRNLDELSQMIEPRAGTSAASAKGRNNSSSNNNNEVYNVESLRNILKTLLDEIETLKQKCMTVETRYKEATITASRELQESMNILFKLQQKTATLEDSSKAVDRLTHDLKVIKVRLAEKEKECRWLTSEGQTKDNKIQEQANEIKGLAALVGGNSIDLAKQAEEARRANLLSEEVKDLTQKIKQLKAENTSLRSRVDEWNQSQKGQNPPLANNSNGGAASSDKEKKDLMDALVSKDDEMAHLKQEITRLRETISTIQSSGDMGAALEMERELRYEAERKAEKERNDRLAAEMEWNTLSEQVVEDMENSRRQYEKLSDSKAELEKELEVYRVTRSATGAVSHEVENKLVETKYELRKAQISLMELKGETSYHIRVYFSIKGAATSKSTAKGQDSPYIRLSSDGVSIKVSESIFRGAGSGILDSNTGAGVDNSRKYMCDRVFSRSDPEHSLLLAGSIDEYIQFALEGHQSSVISYGKTSSERSQLLFGTTEDVTTGLTFRSLHLFVGRLQALENEGWSFTIHTSFVRIFEDNILDMFGNSTNVTHEVQKNEEGIIAITNVNMLTTNWKDREYITSLSSRVCQSYSLQMNTEEGPRLHFVLTFQISGTHLAKENVIEGQYSLVHVSGAENISKSRSMQCFAELFPSISKRQSHIPYRNSKLTYLLQPSLSPTGRSILICSFDGSDPSTYDSTMNTLQLAAQAFDCTIASSSTASSGGNRISKSDSRKVKSSSRQPPKMKLNLL